ncbi:hypothetical protein DOTSEDRAFT_68211, partial [Dothistroma septosporum NZE10]
MSSPSTLRNTIVLQPRAIGSAILARQNTTMGSIGEQERTYPLRKPEGHKPPVPRWSLQFAESIKQVYTLYIGVQSHHGNEEARSQAEAVVESILGDADIQEPVIDTFRVTNGFDLVGSKCWVLYWQYADGFEAALRRLDLQRVWSALGDAKKDIGLWIEHFVAPIERLETNYARLDHKPGLAQLPNTVQPAHELTAYWGAARDRIPASARDLFEAPKDVPLPSSVPTGFGERLTGTNYDNMCHIRSGQWWQNCGEEERAAYEGDLEIKLMAGMEYLWENPKETGTIGLRFLQNLDGKGHP